MLIQIEAQSAKPKPRNVFYSYSHKDEELRDRLDTHLTILKREGFISTWHDRKIRPGDEWDHIINDHLNRADIILFLISHDFLTSQYCRDIEVRRAMERSHKGNAVLVPIILKPCGWTSEEFAKLQVLPKNCRPLVDWPEPGFAQVAEELRTMMFDLLYPRKPEPKENGQHGHWILKLKERPAIDTQVRAQHVVQNLRDFTGDFSINLQATATTQIADGENLQIGLLLILTGTPEAFSKIQTAQRSNQLASALQEDIHSFYVVHGATVQGSSIIGGSTDASAVDGASYILQPGRKVTTPHFKGLLLPKGTTGSLEFQFRRGDNELNDEERKTNYQHLTDYFHTSLVIKDELQWVNLSAYEADRMLPPELSGTALGRNLLSQDCVLKRLTASFMHPDSPTGRKYWNAVYAEARLKRGTSKLPFHSFQKVWIIPKEAAVYTKDGDEAGAEDLVAKKIEAAMNVPPGYIGVYTLRNHLGVQCESDLVAAQHSSAAKSGFEFGNNDFTQRLFNEIIVPAIEQEVNQGEHFCEIRRIYSAMILATWLKHVVKEGKISNSEICGLADCGDTKSSRRFVVGKIVPRMSAQPENRNKRHSCSEIGSLEHSTPNDPAFDVPENVEFFQQYVRLFKNGLYRCARNEDGDSPGERIIRVYFSGAISFINLGNVISVFQSSKPLPKGFAIPFTTTPFDQRVDELIRDLKTGDME